MINFTEEDIQFVMKAVEIKNRGLYVSSQTLTDHYNRILGKNVKNTNCGSCCRQRISELERALNKWLEANNAKNAEKKVEEDTKVAEEATENTDVTKTEENVTENKEAEQQPPEITEEPKNATVKRASKKKSSRKKGG